MTKLTIGIPIKSSADPQGGGAYSYSQQLLRAIDERTWDERFEIVFLHFGAAAPVSNFKKRCISFHPFAKASFTDKLRKAEIVFLKLFGPSSAVSALETIHAKRRELLTCAELQRSGISLLYYLDPEVAVTAYPFIVTHWDIGHRSAYAFPELCSVNEYAGRSRYYSEVIPLALKIFTESQAGKDELIRIMQIYPRKIEVIPLFPGPVILEQVDETTQHNILSSFNIEKDRYLFYPAQFWPHKNHLLLVAALANLKISTPGLKLVLAGADKGNLPYIKKEVGRMNLEHDVIFTGFVNLQQLYTLYKNATMMVMPTFLGPSNIPPLEAAALGCPVVLSDLAGHREMMGGHALYFDPENGEELVEKIKLAMKNREKMKQAMQDTTLFSLEHAVNKIEEALLHTVQIRRNWQP